MRDTVLFVICPSKQKTGMLVDETSETLPKLLCELNFNGQQIFNVHHEQDFL